MRTLAMFVLLLVSSTLAADERAPAKPIAPSETPDHVGKTVTVEMKVLSTGGRQNLYLNSHADFKDANNFTVMIPGGRNDTNSLKKLEAAFKKAGIKENLKEHFKNKTIRVTGKIMPFTENSQATERPVDKLRIIVAKSSQIKVVPAAPQD